MLCSEYRTHEAGDTYRRESAEMGQFRTIQHCTRVDRRKSEERREHFKIKSLENKTEIEEQRQKWIHHLDTVIDGRLLKRTVQYITKGHQYHRRPWET